MISLGLVALGGLALGLATDVGLFGWSLAVIVGLYLGAAAVARRRSGSPGVPS